MSSVNVEECLQSVEQIAREVGELIQAAFYQDKTVDTKAGFADLVTETDQKVEQIIISTLKDKYPTHSFIGEESTVAGVRIQLTDDPTWIIDPIDGTTNFVHRFPYIAVSIGFLVNKQTEAALIYNPILKEMFTAVRGKGAFCNGKPLKTTNTEDVKGSMICMEFGSSRDPDKLNSKFRSMRNIIQNVHGIRSIGSAACSMMVVAQGFVDAYLEFGVHAWDYAAGDLIVREAGGVVMDTTGGPLDLMARRVLCAGTKKLALQLADTVEQMEFERD